MCEQHVESDFAAANVIISEFGNNCSDWGFEIEQAALVEDHGHGGRRDHFSERSEIEEARGGDLRRSRIVGQAAESLVGHEFSAEGDRKRRGREGAGCDGPFYDAERIAKPIVLRDEIAHQERKSRLSIGQRQLQGYFVN